ncbi:Seven transmembrane MLO family protein [Trifolium repens]|nr:Seven transmembrane MLO family protein [Trifolium repens]
MTKSKVPLLSAEAVQQIHIFIILLGTVYFILSFIIFHFGSVTIHCWQKYNTGKSKRDYQNAMKKKLVHSHNDRFLPLKILCQSFFKQFIIGVVTESDYMEIAVGLCMDHDGDAITEELKKFHKDISSSHEKNFWQIVGIRLVLT